MATAEELADVQAERPARGRGARFWHHPDGIAGVVVLAAVVAAAAFAPALTHWSPLAQNLSAQFLPPGSPAHPLGTDSLGRDLFSRLLYGARYSLAIAIIATLLGMLAGVPIGLVAGYAGGRVDGVIMRVTDVLLAFPYLLLAIVVVGALGPGLINALLAVSISAIPFYVRLVRGQVQSIRKAEFVESARALGARNARIVLRAIVPAILPYLLVMFAANAGFILVQASALSFLGLGVQPPTPEWGSILAENRQYVTVAPFTVLLPGLCIVIVVLGLNLLADALRDVLDVRADV